SSATAPTSAYIYTLSLHDALPISLMKATLSLYADTISLGWVSDVFLINLNSDEGCSSPSMTNVPLNILWRQCSELACENANTSESVSLRPILSDNWWRYSTSSTLRAKPSCLL